MAPPRRWRTRIVPAKGSAGDLLVTLTSTSRRRSTTNSVTARSACRGVPREPAGAPGGVGGARRRPRAVHHLGCREFAGVHRRLRIYQRKGLIEPARTVGRSRRYSDRDIALLRRIQELTNDGVGLAGVRRSSSSKRPSDGSPTSSRHARCEAGEEIQWVHRNYRRDLVPVGTAAVANRRRALEQPSESRWSARGELRSSIALRGSECRRSAPASCGRSIALRGSSECRRGVVAAEPLFDREGSRSRSRAPRDGRTRRTRASRLRRRAAGCRGHRGPPHRSRPAR